MVGTDVMFDCSRERAAIATSINVIVPFSLGNISSCIPLYFVFTRTVYAGQNNYNS
jgi:hypothetical protein